MATAMGEGGLLFRSFMTEAMAGSVLGVAAGSNGEGGTTMGVVEDLGGSEARGVPYLACKRLRCILSIFLEVCREVCVRGCRGISPDLTSMRTKFGEYDRRVRLPRWSSLFTLLPPDS